MPVTYDKYYQTENLFGAPYPELIEFMSEYPTKGKVLDLGCGQGRDAIALAELGYEVTGIDNSKVGIEQMNQIAQAKNLNLVGQVEDIYQFNAFDAYDIVLLDSMFHFAKKDKEREVGFVKRIIARLKKGSLMIVCIQDSGNKVLTLNQAIDTEGKHHRLLDQKFKYVFIDQDSQHRSASDYRMIVVEK